MWNKPKKVLNNLLIYLGVISSVLAFVAISVSYIWIYYPTVVNKIDNKLLDNYVSSFQGKINYASTLQKNGNYKKSRAEFKKVLDLAFDFSKNDRLYHTVKLEAIRNIITLSVLLEEYDKALEIASLWVESDRNDIDAKLTYLDVMAHNEKNFAVIENEYNKLIKKFYNVEKIYYNYRKFLLKNKKYKKLLTLNRTNFNNKINHKGEGVFSDIGFKIYYAHNSQDKFNEINTISKLNYKKNNNSYTIQASGYFTNLIKMRFDVERLHSKSDIKKFKVEFLTSNSVHEYYLEELLQSNGVGIQDGVFVLSPNDPYFSLNIPKKLVGYTGPLDMQFQFILKESVIFNKIQNHKNNSGWKLFYGNSNEVFTEAKSKSFYLVNESAVSDDFTTKISIKKKNIDKLRIDFAPVKLKITKLKLNVYDLDNNVYAYDLLMNNIRYNDVMYTKSKSLKVDGVDPYVVINLRNKIDIDYVTLSFGD